MEGAFILAHGLGFTSPWWASHGSRSLKHWSHWIDNQKNRGVNESSTWPTFSSLDSLGLEPGHGITSMSPVNMSFPRWKIILHRCACRLVSYTSSEMVMLIINTITPESEAQAVVGCRKSRRPGWDRSSLKNRTRKTWEVYVGCALSCGN